MQLLLQILSFTFLLFIVHTTASPLWWDDHPEPPTGTTGDFSYPIRPRDPANTSVNPEAVTGTTCIDPTAVLNTHDTNVAILSICGGIAGSIEFCGGDPSTTVGASGTSKFTLTAVNAAQGATINVSKGRWEGCVRAAQAVCPTGTYSSTCVGGTSDGAGFTFVLSENN
ncbi:uncharacterized protein PV07_09948 [Cladophialophora immunda]|uniref:Uncharacterized protein n=1 Tax=Cladophialophora immunda TaxID=569365 RepID=A0A0D2C157_9EURO|nr:uncharacterized protein PV07_09948 [Cladophialophora immunda]KIW24220.1 hypothetical protein PV07_09948 [Cladophialophora immunda]OQV07594.1 hypothetical protein CLAIMM_12002 [Cladophialophora immunda]